MEMVTFARRDQANKAGPHTLTILCILVRSLSQVLIFFNDVLGGNVNNRFFCGFIEIKDETEEWA